MNEVIQSIALILIVSLLFIVTCVTMGISMRIGAHKEHAMSKQQADLIVAQQGIIDTQKAVIDAMVNQVTSAATLPTDDPALVDAAVAALGVSSAALTASVDQLRGALNARFPVTDPTGPVLL